MKDKINKESDRMNNFRQTVENKSKELQISIPELAKLAGVNYKTLKDNMNKKSPNPNINLLKKLSIALGTSLDSLVFGENIEEDEEIGILLKELKTIRSDDKKRILYMIRMMIAESKQKT